MTQTTKPRRRWKPQYLAGLELRRRREEAGMSQAEFVKRARVTQNQLAHWEAEDYGCGIETVVKLAAALPGCKPEDLMHDDGIGRYKALTRALNAA